MTRAIQICSGLGAGNLGDELMAHAFWKALPKGYRLRVEHLGLFARHTASYPPEHEYDVVTLDARLATRAPELPGLLVGATPVSEELGLDWPLRYLAGRLGPFHERGLPVDALGVGVDLLRSPGAIELFREAFLPVRSWTVRSERCRDALLSLGVDPNRIATGADWAWLCDPLSGGVAPGAGTFGAERWRGLGVRLDRPLIVVNVVNEVWADGPGTKPTLALALDALALGHGFQVAFLCNEIRSGPFYDRAAAEDVRSQMRAPSVLVPNEPYLPDELTDLLSYATLTLGQRYHFVLASVLADVPPLGVARGQKVRSLLIDLGLDPVGDMTSLSVDTVVEAALRTQRERGPIVERLRERRRDLRERAAMNLRFLDLGPVASGTREVPARTVAEAPPPLTLFRRILLPRFDGLGDMVLLAGFLEELLARCADDASVTLLVLPGTAELAPLFPARLRWETLALTPFAERAPGEELIALRQTLRAHSPDLVIVSRFGHTWADAACGLFAGAGARKIALGGPEGSLGAPLSLRRAVGDCEPEGGGPPWDVIVPVEPASPEGAKYEALWRALVPAGEPLGPPRLRSPEVALATARDVLEGLGLTPGGYAVCLPAGVAHVAIKVWPAARYAAVIEGIEARCGLVSLVIGHESERAILEATARGATELGAHPRVWIGRGGEVPVMAALLGAARVFVGNDTGALHISAALGVPSVGVFGGGTWPRFNPPENVIVLAHPLPCFGCGWDCVLGDTLCLSLVGVDDVLRATERALSPERRSGARLEVVDLCPPGGDIAFPGTHVARLLERLRRVEAVAAARLEIMEGLVRQVAPRPQDGVLRVPADLRRLGLEHAGVYEDGWVAEAVFITLSMPTPEATLRVAGMVPRIADPAFETELRISVDREEVLRVTLRLGDFDVRAAPPDGPGPRRIELRFSRRQLLPPPDGRSVSALLSCVGFENTQSG